jgi:transcriptional regulator GlxA family with amidase domain
VSRGYIHERFVTETGFSPKRYAALRRFSRVKSLLRKSDAESFASVALSAGYADHAHLSREVRKFAGRTPGELVRDLQDPIALEVERLLSAGGGLYPGRG